jgi:hypothetical protein
MNTSLLTESVMLICENCESVIYEKALGDFRPRASPIPPDWSFIQLGTTGEHNGQPFTIVGRIRLQLRNDYKNFWCAALENGAALWLMESFASFAVFPMTWHMYTNSVSDVRAGKTFNARSGLKLTGEYVEKCEDIGYEGEVGSWKSFHPGFFFLQAANKESEVAVFSIVNKKKVDYLTGIKVTPESLNLKNIIMWDEWK